MRYIDLQSPVNPCKDLPAPVNGAMSCDTWMFGRQCQMQCSDKFDIPAVGDGFSGIFTCSEREGIFKPLNTVPNCTGNKLPIIHLHFIRTILQMFAVSNSLRYI